MTVRMPVANGDAKPDPLRAPRSRRRRVHYGASTFAEGAGADRRIAGRQPYRSDPRISPPEGVTAAHQVGEAMLYLMGMEVRVVSPFSSIE
jgi:hypothetical protein